MDLKDTFILKKTDNIDVANKLLEQNWVLIDKYTVAKYPDYPNDLSMVYVLGITKDNFSNYDDTVIEKMEKPYSSYGTYL